MIRFLGVEAVLQVHKPSVSSAFFLKKTRFLGPQGCMGTKSLAFFGFFQYIGRKSDGKGSFFFMKLSKRDQELVSVERLRATERLASEIAHELNTPLGGILMYSHLLLEDIGEGNPYRENVIKINKLAHRCKMIVQGFLDFARQGSPQLRPVQVNRIIYNVMGFMEDHVLLRGIDVDTELDATLPEILGEENKLEQVFVNLIVNAAQSMDGQGVLSLRTQFIPDTNQIRIECADTGCGIAEEHLREIFEPLFTTKQRGKGTGLGLSICHGIVEQHRGTTRSLSENPVLGGCWKMSRCKASEPL
jgi:signal transduction histidine kinase